MANHQIDYIINDHINDHEKITVMRNSRNVVFHVAEPTLDPYRLDDLASYVGPETEQHLFVGFSMFLGAIAAYATSNGSTKDLG